MQNNQCGEFDGALAANVSEPINALWQAVVAEFAGRIVSMFLHGSISLGDLAVGYSDIDFVVIFQDSISEADCVTIRDMRAAFRSGGHGELGPVMEGAFLPRAMLNPANCGRAFWWGTSGERPWNQNELGWFTLWVLREKGIRVGGEDIRGDIPAPPKEGLALQVQEFVTGARAHPFGGNVKAVDWLLTSARMLKWVKLGVMSSKSDAASWAQKNAAGNWTDYLPMAAQIRRDTRIAERPDIKSWLKTLQEPILSSLDELESELRAMAAEN